MADYFLGEIRPFANNFAPYGWMQCNGQLLPIQQYSALFSILGTYYGGNGTTNFQLPNIQGTVLVGTGQLPGGSNYVIGETGGAPSVNIDISTMPAHNHRYNGAIGSTPAITIANVTNAPVANVSLLSNQYSKDSAGGITPVLAYTHTTPVNTQLGANAIGVTGSGIPHENRQPFLVINYCIAIYGEFPVRN